MPGSNHRLSAPPWLHRARHTLCAVPIASACFVSSRFVSISWFASSCSSPFRLRVHPKPVPQNVFTTYPADCSAHGPLPLHCCTCCLPPTLCIVSPAISFLLPSRIASLVRIRTSICIHTYIHTRIYLPNTVFEVVPTVLIQPCSWSSRLVSYYTDPVLHVSEVPVTISAVDRPGLV